MLKKNYEISIVTALLNEEEVVGKFYERVSSALAAERCDYEILFVDDGSQDRSFEILKEIQKKNPDKVKVLRLARNFGHQLALTAGIRAAQGKAVVVIDCDLQDPPEVISKFITHWREGYEIVYGLRIERKGETWFKKATARIFYKFIRFATNIDIPENVGDFYLLDRKVVETLNRMEERHRFLRGMIAWTGFRRKAVEYVREPRLAGHTKYSLWKMIKFSFDAATSFSFLPLRAISFLGFLISFFAFLGILVTCYLRLFTDVTITGWSSLMVVVLFIGGIQLLAMGLIGEYLARIGDDTKRRPLYVVKEFLGNDG